jgi:hypothetical protein
MIAGQATWPAAREDSVRAVICLGIVLAAMGLERLAWGQQPIDFEAKPTPTTGPYDGVQAGLDAFRLAEEKRQAAVAMQLATNAQMRAWSGLPLARGTSTYYGFAGVESGRLPVLMDLDFAYGIAYRRFVPGDRLSVFEPWPLVPGDIYGVVVAPPVRQSVGQWQGQTGPRRWESHPIYDPPFPAYRPLPEVESPLLDKTPYTTPRRGPREY